MSQSWNKVKIWTKLILIGLVTLFVLIFAYKNYSQNVSVWLFGAHTMTVLELLIATFLIGVVAALLAGPIYRTLLQISELSKKEPVIPLAPPPAAKAPGDVPKPSIPKP